MKKYLAIGYFKGSENMTSVAMKCTSRADFVKDLRGNRFIPWAILTEKKMAIIESKLDDSYELLKEVRKLSSNYYKWDFLCDYIGQCFDIMQERMETAE